MTAAYKTANIEVITDTKSAVLDSLGRYEFANFLRAIAVISVVFGGHFVVVFWFYTIAAFQLLGIDMPPVIVPPNWLTLLHAPSFNYGQFGVAIFFLISGFVIPFSCTKLNQKAFVTVRAFRIYPTYWVGLTFSLITLLYLNSNNENLGFYNIGLQYLLVRDMAWIPSLDGISWTLEIELKFYIICAIISSIIIQANLKRLFVIIFILGCLSAVSGYSSFVQFVQPWSSVINSISLSAHFIIYMFIGTFFYWNCCNKLDTKTLYISIMIVFIWFSVVWSVNGILKSSWSTGMINYFVAFLCFYLFYNFRNFIKTPRVFKWFADVSFSLYVVHPIVGYALLYYFAYVRQEDAFLSIVFTSIIVLILAQIINKLIEVPSNKLGKKIAGRFI